ncbi:MAG: ATP-binding protein [Oscillospiraceae bacterium]|jgi:DNA replication protein DnaC|nr:ATP-binding protein [Oscillospiraceae bacterium]
MKTSAHYIIKAEQELKRRREKAASRLRSHRTEAYAKCPALQQLDNEIADTAAEIGQALAHSFKEGQALLQDLRMINQNAQAQREKLLRKAGFPADYLTEQFTCKKCRDTGFVNGIRCDCFRTLLQQLAYKELCMDTPLENSSFDKFRLDIFNDKATAARMRQIKESAEKYAADFDEHAPSLLFLGGTGLGKTHISLAIAGAVINRGYAVLYGSVPTLMGKLEREHFGRSSENTGAVEESLLSCSLLILDDLGAEFSTSFTQAAIYNILNTRLLRGLPTIISSNLDSYGLEEKYGSRVHSRLMGEFGVWRFEGKDLRGPGK